jgi:hypothetical protein
MGAGATRRVKSAERFVSILLQIFHLLFLEMGVQ